MPGLRKRIASEGITPLQFAFQLVVVLLGVYLAIHFESKAEDRSRQAEALAMLGNVLGELELDEEELWASHPEGSRDSRHFRPYAGLADCCL